MEAVSDQPSMPLRQLAVVSLLVGTLNVIATGIALTSLPRVTARGERILLAAGALVSVVAFIFGTMLSLRKAAARRVGFVAVAVITLLATLFALVGVVEPDAALYFYAWTAALLGYVGFVTRRLVRWEPHPSELPRIDVPVFISYRRDDSRDTVGRIHDHLRDRFDDAHVFLDVDDQAAGEDYRVVIDRALERTTNVLVVIGPDWLSAADTTGRRRIDDPDDMVRIEIERALHSVMRIVPVLVEGATMPKASELPEPLRPLCYRTALVVRPDPDFALDMQRLIVALEAAP